MPREASQLSVQKSITLDNAEETRALLGDGDCHLRRVRTALGLNVVVRRDLLHLNGPENSVKQGLRTFMDMLDIVRTGQPLHDGDVVRILDNIQSGSHDPVTSAVSAEDRGVLAYAGTPVSLQSWTKMKPNRSHSSSGRSSHDSHSHSKNSDDSFTPRTDQGGWNQPGEKDKDEPIAHKVRAITAGQHRYVEAIKDHDVVFAIGPAGSGKTYLAVALAIECLAQRMVNRLVLVRPAVEAGEHLGFLPGDLREKVNPYLRPLYDALHDLLNPNQVARFMERGVIEVAPLAFMRGRTLNNAFVILDEAQNTTPKQMKMFLTRLGNHSRAVITGDVTQVDLPEGDLSGLAHARDVLKDVKGVSFVHLEKSDIVRHPLVQRIVDAYEEKEKTF